MRLNLIIGGAVDRGMEGRNDRDFCGTLTAAPQRHDPRWISQGYERAQILVNSLASFKVWRLALILTLNLILTLALTLTLIHRIVKNVILCCSVKISLQWNYGAWPEPWKDSRRPLFLSHQTLQLALCIGAGSVLLASTKPRFVHRTARWWSVIHHSRERVSTAPESNGSEQYTTPADAWHYAWWT